MTRGVIIGALGAAGLLGLYVATMSLDGGLSVSLRLLQDEWWIIGGIAALFGIQLGLYVRLRQYIRSKPSDGSEAAGAVTTGTTGGSMLACCLHHLVDVVPFLGATALGAFLGEIRGWLFGVAYLASAIGIALMVRALRHTTRMAEVPACH